MAEVYERNLYRQIYAWNKDCLLQFSHFFPNGEIPRLGEELDRALIIFNGVVFGTGITVELLRKAFPVLQKTTVSELESMVKLTTAFMEVRV